MKKVIVPKPGKLRRMGRKIPSAIVIVILFLSSLSVLSNSFNLPGGYRNYTVLTGSMEPFLPVGSLITTKAPRDISDIRIGDIITFTKPGQQDVAITHRVADLDKGQFITKGDANAAADNWITPFENIQGVYKWHIPLAGSFLQFVKTPAGVILFIIIPALYIIITEIKNIITILLDKKIKYLETLKQEINNMRRHNISPPANTPFRARIQVDTVKRRQRRHSSSVIKKVTVKPLAACLILTAGFVAADITYSSLISNTVTIAGSTLTTAEIFPTPSPIPDTANCNLNINAELTNNHTGSGSNNDNTLKVDHNCVITEEIHTNIDNSINIDANTGNNSSNDNTKGKNIETGDVNISIKIDNSN